MEVLSATADDDRGMSVLVVSSVTWMISLESLGGVVNRNYLDKKPVTVTSAWVVLVNFLAAPTTSA